MTCSRISRRRLAGERPSVLAAEFGVSPERIWQIVQAEQRRQRGEAPAPRRRCGTQAALPEASWWSEAHAVRPRLRKAALAR